MTYWNVFPEHVQWGWNIQLFQGMLAWGGLWHCLFSLHLILNLASPRFAQKLSHNSESMPRVFAVELSQLSAQAFSDHQPVALCEIVRWALCSCRFWPCAPSRSGLSVPGQKSTGNVGIGDIWNHHRLLYTRHIYIYTYVINYICTYIITYYIIYNHIIDNIYIYIYGTSSSIYWTHIKIN